MPDDALLIEEVTAAAKATLDGVEGLKTVYDHEPLSPDALPAATLAPPRLERVGLEENEDQIGSADWKYFYDLTLYVALDEPKTGQKKAAKLVGQIVRAFDRNPTLQVNGVDTSGVHDAKVVSATGTPATDEGQREVYVYDCVLAVLRRPDQ